MDNTIYIHNSEEVAEQAYERTLSARTSFSSEYSIDEDLDAYFAACHSKKREATTAGSTSSSSRSRSSSSVESDAEEGCFVEVPESRPFHSYVPPLATNVLANSTRRVAPVTTSPLRGRPRVSRASSTLYQTHADPMDVRSAAAAHNHLASSSPSHFHSQQQQQMMLRNVLCSPFITIEPYVPPPTTTNKGDEDDDETQESGIKSTQEKRAKKSTIEDCDAVFLEALSAVYQSRSSRYIVKHIKKLNQNEQESRRDISSNNSASALPEEIVQWRISSALKMCFPSGTTAVLERLIILANEVSKLEWYLDGLDNALAVSPGRIPPDVTAPLVEPMRGAEALYSTSRSALSRFTHCVRQQVSEFRSRILAIQQTWVREDRGREEEKEGGAVAAGPASSTAVYTRMCRLQSNDTDAAHLYEEGQLGKTIAKKEKGKRKNGSLPQLMDSVLSLAVPLQRHLVMIEKSKCCEQLLRPDDASFITMQPSTATGDAMDEGEEYCAADESWGTYDDNGQRRTAAIEADKQLTPHQQSTVQASTSLMDYVTMQLNVLQEPSHSTAFSVNVVMLCYLLWPYTNLMICAMHGIVSEIDTRQWRMWLPRALRTSFSHLRVAALGAPGSTDSKSKADLEVATCLPTDVLSLVLTCVGFDDAADDLQETLGREQAHAQVSLAHLRATHNSIRSCRSYVLRHFSTFAKRAAGTKKSAARALSPMALKALWDNAEDVANGQKKRQRRLSFHHSVDTAAAEAGEEQRKVRQSNDFHYFREAKSTRGSSKTAKQQSRLRNVGGDTQAEARHGDGARDAVTPQRSLAVNEELQQVKEYAKGAVDEEGRLRWAKVQQRYSSLWVPLALPTSKTAFSSTFEEHAVVGHSAPCEDELSAVWRLDVVDDQDTQDIILVYDTDRSDVSKAGNHLFASYKNTRFLWFNTAAPVPRWISAAFLVPIGQLVRRNQERRITELLSSTRQRISFGREHMLHLTALRFEEEDNSYSVQPWTNSMGNYSSPTKNYKTGIQRSDTHHIPPNFSFSDALTLLDSVALCGETERIVEGFIGRLVDEPHWWFRRDKYEYSLMGTASTFITAAFAEAIRGMPYGYLVRLSVLPDDDTKGAERNEADDNYGLQILKTFQSFRLHFSFPPVHARILCPANLSFVANAEGQFEAAVFTQLFWKQRSQNLDATSPPTDASNVDVWSLVFKSLCATYYAKRVLQDHRKDLQMRDVEAFQLTTLIGEQTEPIKKSNASWYASRIANMKTQPLRVVPSDEKLEAASAIQNQVKQMARGTGNAYYTLGFVVDAYLRFLVTNIRAQWSIFLRSLQNKPQTYSELCFYMDRTLFNLAITGLDFTLSTQSASAPTHQDPLRNTSAHACDAIRTNLEAVLAIAADPRRQSTHAILRRTEDNVVAIVETVTSLSTAAVLRKHLTPFTNELTFNQHFGESIASFSFN